MWRTCLGANGFLAGRQYGYDHTIEEVLRHAAELGYDGIELHHGLDPLPDPEDASAIEAYSRKVRSAGLEVAGIQARVTSGGIASDDPAVRAAWTREAIAQVMLCHRLGGTQCGFWPAGKRDDLTDSDLVARLSEALRPVANNAEALGVMTTIEPEPVQIDYDYAIAARIVDAVGSAYFRLIYDCAHAEVLTGDALRAVRTYGPYIGHVHFCDADGTTRDAEGASHTSTHLAAGEGRLDLNAILRALEEVGYTRWLQVDVWEHPNPFECSRATKQIVDAFQAGEHG